MEIEFDPSKDILNIRNHGISLAEAANIDWDAALTWSDIRYHYNETRFVSLAPIETKLYYVVYTELSDDLLRIISLRKAEKTEVKRYVNEI